MPVKGIVEALDRSFYILVPNIFERTVKMDKQKVSGRFNDKIDKIVITDLQTSGDILPPIGVISAVVSREWTAKVDVDREKSD